MKALKSPSRTFALPAPSAFSFKVTEADLKRWKQARMKKLMEKQRYWESCQAK